MSVIFRRTGRLFPLESIKLEINKKSLGGFLYELPPPPAGFSHFHSIPLLGYKMNQIIFH